MTGTYSRCFCYLLLVVAVLLVSSSDYGAADLIISNQLELITYDDQSLHPNPYQLCSSFLFFPISFIPTSKTKGKRDGIRGTLQAEIQRLKIFDRGL